MLHLAGARALAAGASGEIAEAADQVVAEMVEISQTGDLWTGLGVAGGVFLLLYLIKGFLSAKFLMKDQPGVSWREVVRRTAAKTTFLFILAVSLWAGLQVADLPDNIENAVAVATGVMMTLQVALWIGAFIMGAIEHYAATNAAEQSTINNAMSLIRISVWTLVMALAVMLILDNLGQDVTALLAGLGILGIGVGLAAQGVFSDLFASLSIVLDRPFVKGDFIIFGDILGTVERIGLKTTRLRSLGGEEISVPNSDLVSTRVRNYKRMYERRIVFGLGVTYDTGAEKLRRAKQIITEVIEAQDQTRLDRVHFASYGDFSLNFEIVYYVLSPDYAVYMDVQEAINLALYERFEEAGLVFAFPTQTLYIEDEDEGEDGGETPAGGRARNAPRTSIQPPAEPNPAGADDGM